MAFDPDAWLKANGGPAPAAAQAQPKAFDPDAWLANNGPDATSSPTPAAAPPPAAEEPQGLGAYARQGAKAMESFARSFQQAVPFSEEIAAGGAALVDKGKQALGMAPSRPIGEVYDERLQGERAANVEASKDKVASLTGSAASMLLPGPKGVLVNAALGGAYGAGAADGDLSDRATGALTGAGVALAAGGAIKGAGALGRKVIGGAPARVEARATDALLEGTPARTVQDPAIAKLGGKENIPKILKQEGLEKALHGKASKLEAELDKRLDEVGGKLGGIYERVTKADPGVPPEYVYDQLLALAAKKKADPEAADAIRSYAGKLRESYNEQGAMSAQDLHEVVKVLGQRGYATNPMNPSMSSQLRRELRGEVLGVLQQHVDDVAKTNPGVGSLDELKELNGRYRRLTAIDDIAASKAQRDERYSPTLGQRAQQVSRAAVGGMGAMGAAQQLMEGNAGTAAVSALAGGAAMAAPHIVRAADKLAAGIGDTRLANFLRTSPNLQELIERATRIGIPREAALAAAGLTGGQQPAGQPQPAPAPVGGGAPLLSGR